MVTKKAAKDNGQTPEQQPITITLPAFFDYSEIYETATTQPEAFRLNEEQTERIGGALEVAEDSAETLADFIKISYEKAGIITPDEFFFWAFSVGRVAGVREARRDPMAVLKAMLSQ